jgi:hypothetical protein
MHWQTWGADDAIYSVDGDGEFFGTGDYYVSLSRITGTPPEHRIGLRVLCRRDNRLWLNSLSFR